MNPQSSTITLVAGMIVIGAVAGLHAWTSRINQFFFFARTLPATFTCTPQAKAITHRYLGMVLISAGLAMFLFDWLYAVGSHSFVVSLIISLLLEISGVTIAFAVAHRLAGSAYAAFQETAAAEPTVEPGPVADRAISVPLLAGATQASPRSMFAPMLAAVSFWLGGVAVSDYGMAAFANAAGEQGGAVLLGMATGMLFAGIAMRLLLRYSARQRTPMAHYIARVMALLSWVSVALIGGIVVAVHLHFTVTRTMAHSVMLIVFACAIGSVLYMWSRNNRFTPTSAEQNGDQHWHAGLFYYNRQDPALFVQRRSGPGFTLNFGNVFSWPLTAFIVADFAFIFISRHHL